MTKRSLKKQAKAAHWGGRMMATGSLTQAERDRARRIKRQEDLAVKRLRARERQLTDGATPYTPTKEEQAAAKEPVSLRSLVMPTAHGETRVFGFISARYWTGEKPGNGECVTSTSFIRKPISKGEQARLRADTHQALYAEMIQQVWRLRGLDEGPKVQTTTQFLEVWVVDTEPDPVRNGTRARLYAWEHGYETDEHAGLPRLKASGAPDLKALVAELERKRGALRHGEGSDESGAAAAGVPGQQGRRGGDLRAGGAGTESAPSDDLGQVTGPGGGGLGVPPAADEADDPLPRGTGVGADDGGQAGAG
jgi:hypothetical protein